MLCISIVFASCQRASPTTAAADEYLEALRSGNAELIADLTCLKDPMPRENIVPGISSWDFVDESLETSASDPLSSHTNVLTKIRYEGMASPVENLFELAVWKTEDLYQYQLRLNESLNQGTARTNELITRIDAMLGKETEPSGGEEDISEAPSREELTSREYCVTQLRQFQE